MQDLNDDNRKDILGEVLFDELKAIHESIADLPTRAEFNELKDTVSELVADNKTFKAVLMDQGRQFNNHERRISTLEQLEHAK